MKLSRIESGIRAVLEFVQALNRHDLAAVLRLLSDDCRLESASPAPDGMVYLGKEAIAQFWQDFFRRAPDARLEVEESFGFGFRCIVRWRCEWTGAAGKEHIRGADIFQVRNGLICEHLSYVKSQ